MDEYYAPNDIRYTWQQNQWLIRNVLPLPTGEWPPEYSDTGYIGDSHSKSNRAPFETACIIIGELSVRLTSASTDGKLLIKQIQLGETYNLEYEARMALAYCCGWKRKQQTYRDWRRNRRYENHRYNTMKVS